MQQHVRGPLCVFTHSCSMVGPSSCRCHHIAVKHDTLCRGNREACVVVTPVLTLHVLHNRCCTTPSGCQAGFLGVVATIGLGVFGTLTSRQQLYSRMLRYRIILVVSGRRTTKAPSFCLHVSRQ